MTARAMLLVHFALASIMLFTSLKSGAFFNYLLDWLCVGCALIGVLLCDLVGTGWRFSLVTALLILGVLNLPFREISVPIPQQQLDRQAALVDLIAAAKKPVASEDMTLLMRAGRPVIFEPAIVTELASLGRWDQEPLVNMIRSGLGWLCFHNHYRRHARRQLSPHPGGGCRYAGGLSTSRTVWPRTVVTSPTKLKRTEISAKTLPVFSNTSSEP